MKMLKRGFFLFLSACLLLTLVACGGGMTAEERAAFDSLQQQVIELQTELGALKGDHTNDVHDTTDSTSVPIPSENDPSDATSASTPSAEPATSPEAALQAAIAQQLASDEFADWLAVAKCENATEENMMALARNVSTCQDWYDYKSSYDVYDVIGAATQNPIMTDRVLAAMCNNLHGFRALYLIARSPYAKSEALKAVAKRLNVIDDWYDYKSSYDAYDVIGALGVSASYTDEALGTIQPGSFQAAYAIARSSYAGEQALSAVVLALVDFDDWYDYKSSYDAYDVIGVIASNPNITLELMTKLAQVDNATARDTAHKFIEQLS